MDILKNQTAKFFWLRSVVFGFNCSWEIPVLCGLVRFSCNLYFTHVVKASK